jgi:predicted Zn-dependent peptidase
VKDKQVALSVDGGVNWPLGTPYEFAGPTLMTSFIVYPPNVSEDQVLSAYDATIKGLAENGPSQQDLDRIVAKMRSDIYGNLEIPIDRASALSHAVLFDGNFDSVYQLPEELSKVTAVQVKAFAAKYLVSTNRTIINRVPAPAAEKEKEKGAGQ